MQTENSADYVSQFDSITTNNAMREAKVLYFHAPRSMQTLLALSIKTNELQLLLRSGTVKDTSQPAQVSLQELIPCLLPYASPSEKIFLSNLSEQINQFLQMKETMEFMQAMQAFNEGESGSDGQGGSANPFSGLQPEDLMNLFQL